MHMTRINQDVAQDYLRRGVEIAGEHALKCALHYGTDNTTALLIYGGSRDLCNAAGLEMEKEFEFINSFVSLPNFIAVRLD